MTRKQPPTPPEVKKRTDTGVIEQTRSYKLITPLFGGGVETGKADPITIVRGTEIRGHLRFWWRATRGGAFGGDLKKMKAKEDEVWGAAAQKDKSGVSKVTLSVEVKNRGQKFAPVNKKGKPIDDIGAPNSIDVYAAFPLRKTGNHVLQNVEFVLKISFLEDYRDEVEAALWAWDTFGGIGARTRRGFGALQCTQVLVNDQPSPLPLPKDDKELKEYVDQNLRSHIPIDGKWPKGVPHLSHTMRTNLGELAPDNTPLESWRFLIGELQAFRQMRSPNKYGKSDWPEPKAIRNIRDGRQGINRFPRASFGLPIIFEFQNTREPTVTLEGSKYDRLASPLILRPLVCANNRGVAMAAILEGWSMPPDGVVLKGETKETVVQTTVSADEVKNIKPLHNRQDALHAFLDYLRKPF